MSRWLRSGCVAQCCAWFVMSSDAMALAGHAPHQLAKSKTASANAYSFAEINNKVQNMVH